MAAHGVGRVDFGGRGDINQRDVRGQRGGPGVCKEPLVQVWERHGSVYPVGVVGCRSDGKKETRLEINEG